MTLKKVTADDIGMTYTCLLEKKIEMKGLKLNEEDRLGLKLVYREHTRIGRENRPSFRQFIFQQLAQWFPGWGGGGGVHSAFPIRKTD
jgi:hypothetical protein